DGGLEKRGLLFAPGEAITGENRVILPYLVPFLENVFILSHKKTYSVGDISFTAYKHEHA
ncbi:MAG: MBL fold metallo-hydrolase, partial [Caldisericaceae bacterium]